MLDVHPPHEPTHTWKDFFIHIATIVVGLLIAVALEQVVERIHEHYQLRELRADLVEENETNRKLMADRINEWLETAAELKQDLITLRYIQQHPGTPQTALPSELSYSQSPFVWRHAVWDAAQQNGTIHLLAPDEAFHRQEFYGVMDGLSAQSLECWNAVNDAARYDLLDTDPTHLSPEKLQHTYDLTEFALAKHIEMGYSYGRMANEFPDMPQTLSWTNIQTLRPSSFKLDPVGMAGAHARMEAALEAGRHALDGAASKGQAK